MKLSALFLCIFWCAVSVAADVPSATVSSASGNLIQITLSLILVIGLLIALSIGFKKFGINRIGSTFPVKVIGAISVGNNQRIMVIEVDDEWIVLGVTPQNISTITSMARQESIHSSTNSDGTAKPNFAAWMQSTLEKYHVKKP